MRCYNVTQYLDETVKVQPDAIAVDDGERKIAFRELYNLVLYNALRINRAVSGKRNKLVAVELGKSIEAVIADLAILYSGNAYMNLGMNNPGERKKAILANTSPELVICGQSEEPGSFPVLRIECSLPEDFDGEAKTLAQSLRMELIDTDLHCVINTSGSTGVPKAVALTHRGFVDFIEAVREAGLLCEKAVIGSLSPVIFDIWSFELCMLMAAAGCIRLLKESDAAFPARLLENMRQSRVSFIFWVPTIMVNIANMDLLSKLNLPDLRMIWFAGEVFPTAKFNYWRRHLPDAIFANFYGPIEITLDCLYWTADRELPDDEPIPIGKPFQNTGIIVMDENDQPQYPPDGEGELCVRGSSLALGYYNSPGKTGAVFTQNPLNSAYPETVYRTGDMVGWNKFGELVFKGRKDTLIKHLGYRIELSEIEHIVVNILHLAKNCCALYDAQAKKIVLVYEEAGADEKTIRSNLAKYLPKYMMPAVFRQVAELPRNPNGKIDRNLLKGEFGKKA